jgi:hypothetical protein
MDRANRDHRWRPAAVALLLAGAMLSAAAVAADAPLETAVLLDQDIADLHVFIGWGAGARRSTGNGMLVDHLVWDSEDRREQAEADRPIAALAGTLEAGGMQSLIREALSVPLADAGLRIDKLAYTAGSRVDPDMLARIGGAKDSARWLIVDTRPEPSLRFAVPTALMPNLRQVRVALRFQLFENRYGRPRRLWSRDVVVYSTPLGRADEEPARQFAEADAAALQTELRTALAAAAALAFAYADAEAPEGDADNLIRLIGAGAAPPLLGHVLANDGERAQVMAIDGTVVSMPLATADHPADRDPTPLQNQFAPLRPDADADAVIEEPGANGDDSHG